MSGITYDYTEQYIRELIPKNTGSLKEMEEYAEKFSVPIVQKEVANFLKLIISLKKPKKILELGTAIGYSSILMSIFAGSECLITTIERDPLMIKTARENIEKYGLQDRIKIIEGDCLDVLSSLNGQYDLIFMDAGKGHYNHFLPHCERMMNDEAIIVADNVLFRGMVASESLVKRRKITIVKRMRSYLQLVSEDRFITSVIPMGDGVAVTKRRNKNEDK